MRTFQGYRPHPPEDYLAKGTAAPPTEVQYEGVLFTDGTLAVRWRTEYRSTSVWASWDDFWHVHGHPEYGTRLTWPLDDVLEQGCAACGMPYTEHYDDARGHTWHADPVEREAIRPTPNYQPPEEALWNAAAVAEAADWHLNLVNPRPVGLLFETPHVPLIEVSCIQCGTRWAPGPWVCPECGHIHQLADVPQAGPSPDLVIMDEPFRHQAVIRTWPPQLPGFRRSGPDRQ